MFILFTLLHILVLFLLIPTNQNITSLYQVETIFIYFFYSLFLGFYLYNKITNICKTHCPKLLNLVYLFTLLYFIGISMPYGLNSFCSTMHIVLLYLAMIGYIVILLKLCKHNVLINININLVLQSLIAINCTVLLYYGTINWFNETLIVYSLIYLLYKIEAL